MALPLGPALRLARMDEKDLVLAPWEAHWIEQQRIQGGSTRVQVTVDLNEQAKHRARYTLITNWLTLGGAFLALSGWASDKVTVEQWGYKALTVAAITRIVADQVHHGAFVQPPPDLKALMGERPSIPSWLPI